MPERIREASLAMGSPRRFMIGERLDVRCAGVGGSIDEPAGFIDEDLDPRGGQPNVGRARLARPAGYCLVHEEWGAVQIQAGNAPRFQSSPAPSAVLYQPIAAAASETINMTDRNGRSISLVMDQA